MQASPEDFEQLARGHRREILAHAYRMLGSVSEAEDAVQETLLRAWRGLDGLETRENFRAWIYKINTHCCLDLLETKKRRVLTSGEPASPDRPPAPPSPEISWLEPIPDALLEPDPEARYVRTEQIGLAFLAALQLLLPRQRAVLLLAEVIGFSAAEIGDLLGVSVAAVNSTLQRARAELTERGQKIGETKRAPDEHTRSLLSRYVEAFQAIDLSSLIALLREDAELTMPPSPTWIRGRDAIAAFYRSLLAPLSGTMRLVPVAANGGHAFLLFAGGGDQAMALQVLELSDGLVSRIDTFFEPEILRRF